MKKIYYIIVTLFLFSISSVSAQNTEGTEFWLTFGENNTIIFSQIELKIRIVSTEMPAKGKIVFTGITEIR